MPTKQNAHRYSVPALDKGLDILEILSVTATPKTMAELARLCGRTRSQIFRMAETLEKRSYISRDPISGAYQLTLKLYQLAHTHSPVDELLRAAYYPMRYLAEESHESCHLCILNGKELLVIAQAQSPTPVRLSVEVGYTADPLKTVSGRLLVAMLNDAERDSFLRTNEAFTAMGKRGQDKLLAKMRAIRQDEYHWAPSSERTGIDVSCLVGSAKIGVTAAIGVPFLAGGRNEGKEEKLLLLIDKHARQITASLGLQDLKQPLYDR